MQHLDEGTIHAWLDGQLPRDEAQRVEAHVAECRQCADAVAEARGLIAASSRILTALDSVPREVVPKQAASFRAAEEAARAADAVADAFVPLEAAVRPRRRWFNGVSMAAAAAIVVAIGTVTVMQRSENDMLSTAAERASSVVATPGPSADSTAAVAAPVPRAPSATPAPALAATRSLGDARSATADRQVAAAPSNARDERAAESNEVVRRAVSDSAIERVAVVKGAESRALEPRALYGTPASSPQISIRGASALRGVDSAKKPVDQLAKDGKQDVPVAQQAQAAPQQLQAPRREAIGAAGAKPDTARADRPQQVAADAAAKTVAGGVVKGRVTDANNTGLANAMVTVNGTNTGVATNEAGEFTLSGVPTGSQRLNVRRIGYEQATRDITVAVGQTLQTDVVLNPSRTELGNVVVTGAPAGATPSGARARAAPAPKPAAPPMDTAPGAPITAAQSNAVGCYELGITALTATRNTFRGMPRRIALDSEIVPANAEGVWYRARDLAKTNVQPNGLWRPTGPDGIEIEWTYGSRTSRVRVTGPAGSMMRGNLEEIDRATANGEAANVVAIRRSCEP
jgi:hypothetical protein